MNFLSESFSRQNRLLINLLILDYIKKNYSNLCGIQPGKEYKVGINNGAHHRLTLESLETDPFELNDNGDLEILFWGPRIKGDRALHRVKPNDISAIHEI